MAMQVINAIYTDPEIYDVFQYGGQSEYVKLYDDDHSYELLEPAYTLANENGYGHALLNRFDRGKNVLAAKAAVDAASIINLPAAYFLPTNYHEILRYFDIQGEREDIASFKTLVAYRIGTMAQADYEMALSDLKQKGLDEEIARVQQEYTAWLSRR